MDKIRISERGKIILSSLKNGNYPDSVPDFDYDEFIVLEVDGLVCGSKCKGGNGVTIVAPRLTEDGKAYITLNPKLKNPSIWDDKKYIINTIISVIALGVSILALLK